MSPDLTFNCIRFKLKKKWFFAFKVLQLGTCGLGQV